MNRVGGSRARWARPPARVNVSGEAPIHYRETLAWLYSLQRFGIKLGLENSRRLFRALGVQDRQFRVIHIAGTNGKGSVSAMIDSILRAQGCRTGLFTSPHLITFRERICVDGKPIFETTAAAGLSAIRSLICEWNPHPTFFEVTTALALKYFQDQEIDIAVLETGLGGRLDATNAVQSDMAVITPIALDHQKWLGKTVAEIAAEKAGIIKAKTPVVSAEQLPDAREVIERRAKECEAPLQFVNDAYEQSPIALRGRYQKLNAGLAIAALRAGRIDINDSAIARGLSSVHWPARFQVWDKRTIIDGAHNPAAAQILADTWQEIFPGERATIILAILEDKDLAGICRTLAPIAEFVLLPQIRSERAAAPDKIARIFQDVCRAGASPAGNRSGCPTISVTASIVDAMDRARTQPNRILITGSLHFAGEALALLEGRPAAFEECAQ